MVGVLFEGYKYQVLLEHDIYFNLLSSTPAHLLAARTPIELLKGELPASCSRNRSHPVHSYRSPLKLRGREGIDGSTC